MYTLWLDARKAEFGEEEWVALAGALRGKPELFNLVWISRQDLTDVRERIRDIWDVTKSQSLPSRFSAKNAHGIVFKAVLTNQTIGTIGNKPGGG